MAFSTSKHSEFWEPQVGRMKAVEGLGSYSSYLGDLSDPKYKRMGYTSRAVPFHPNGSQFDFVWLHVRTPRVGPRYAWRACRNQRNIPTRKLLLLFSVARYSLNWDLSGRFFPYVDEAVDGVVGDAVNDVVDDVVDDAGHGHGHGKHNGAFP